jgi:hypothetical protein
MDGLDGKVTKVKFAHGRQWRVTWLTPAMHVGCRRRAPWPNETSPRPAARRLPCTTAKRARVRAEAGVYQHEGVSWDEVVSHGAAESHTLWSRYARESMERAEIGLLVNERIRVVTRQCTMRNRRCKDAQYLEALHLRVAHELLEHVLRQLGREMQLSCTLNVLERDARQTCISLFARHSWQDAIGTPLHRCRWCIGINSGTQRQPFILLSCPYVPLLPIRQR